MNCSHIDDYIMAVEGLRTLDRQSLEALQLRKLNAMLQRVLNSLPEAVVAIDGNGSITHANNKAANYLLPKNGVLVGKNIDDLFPKPELPRVRSSCGGGFRRRGT